MTALAPSNSEILRRRSIGPTELRALKSRRGSRIRLFLEVNASRLAALLDEDDDRQLVRCSEFDNEADLFAAFDRAALALAR